MALSACEHPDLTPVESGRPAGKPIRPEQIAAPMPHIYTTVANETERNLASLEDPDANLATFRSIARCHPGDLVTGGGCWVAIGSAPGFVSPLFPLVAATPVGQAYLCVAENRGKLTMIVNARAIASTSTPHAGG
jgi:hypothetical protein